MLFLWQLILKAAMKPVLSIVKISNLLLDLFHSNIVEYGSIFLQVGHELNWLRQNNNRAMLLHFYLLQE